MNLENLFKKVRARSLKICDPLETEDYNVQTSYETSPIKWQLAHTSWFFETFILKHLKHYKEFHPKYSFLFNSYYNLVGEQHPKEQRHFLFRPVLEDILRYRKHVDHHMQDLLSRQSTDGKLVRHILLGCHHEEQHQELMLTDLHHMFWSNPLKPAYLTGQTPHLTSESVGPIQYIPFEKKGMVQGFSKDPDPSPFEFSFDNEHPAHETLVGPFEMANRCVTFLEYLEFVEDGGYRQPQYWLSDGWDWIKKHQIDAPLYWKKEGGWMVFTLFGNIPLPQNLPVYGISYYEADAFASWKMARLPTEAEWERVFEAQGQNPILPEKGRTGSNTLPAFHGALFEDQNFLPSGFVAHEGHPQACSQLLGNCWEWTSSPVTGYPGFKASRDALGEYNGKFMSGQMVLKGGSFATPKHHIRKSYRNFWHPHIQYQFAGIRLSRDIYK